MATLHERKLIAGLRERGLLLNGASTNLRRLQYAGGAQGEDLGYFRMIFGADRPLPAREDTCACGHVIVKNLFVTDSQILGEHSRLAVVGSCCIQKFMNSEKICSMCHHRFKGAKFQCRDCRNRKCAVCSRPLQCNGDRLPFKCSDCVATDAVRVGRGYRFTKKCTKCRARMVLFNHDDPRAKSGNCGQCRECSLCHKYVRETTIVNSMRTHGWCEACENMTCPRCHHEVRRSANKNMELYGFCGNCRRDTRVNFHGLCPACAAM